MMDINVGGHPLLVFLLIQLKRAHTMLKRTLDSLAPVYPRHSFPEKLSVDGSRLRLQTITGLRWVAVIGQTISVFAVYQGLGYELPLIACLFVIGMSAVLNLVLQISYPASTRLVSRYAMLLLGYDICSSPCCWG
jgi:hypothetical protein